jgi:hypothetical protein
MPLLPDSLERIAVSDLGLKEGADRGGAEKGLEGRARDVGIPVLASVVEADGEGAR